MHWPGILFAAASGRPLYTLETMFPDLLEEIILIGDNGGAARWKGKDLFVSEMPAEGWRQLARSTKQAGDVGLLCGLQADKFTVYLPNDDSQKAFDRIYGAFHTGNGGAFSVAVAGRNWVDVMNPGVHKGAALAKVGALLGIPADSMMAFGDTYNDAEMLTTAKYGFLMENGSGPLRAQVPFLAPSHREYGVMQVLKQVLRQNGEVSPAFSGSDSFCKNAFGAARRPLQTRKQNNISAEYAQSETAGILNRHNLPEL